MPKMS